MTPIAPHISAFLRERLPVQRAASEHTCNAYADTFRLLFNYASSRFNVSPSELYLEQLDSALILDFLDYLESVRGNTPRSRNARLARIKSFMRFLEYRLPSLLEQSRQILAIPSKKFDSKLINHLTLDEMQTILNAPDLQTRSGIRDRAMLHLGFAAGLRVSELINLPMSEVTLHSTPTVRIMGKGRKERCLPLWKQTADDIRAWLSIRSGIPGANELFLNNHGRPMTRYGFQYVLRKHVATAKKIRPTLKKKHISPHVLRHTCAIIILQATGDLRKVSLWLGHSDIKTTQIYLQVDPTEKLDAIKEIIPPHLKPGCFQPPDKLIALLEKS